MPQFNNTAIVNGYYESTDVTNFSEMSVELTALDIEKTADKDIWVTGPLTITITVTNIDPVLDVENVEIIDQIDTIIAALDEGSLQLTVGGQSQTVVHTYVNGLLTVDVGTLTGGQVAVLTFQLTLVP